MKLQKKCRQLEKEKRKIQEQADSVVQNRMLEIESWSRTFERELVSEIEKRNLLLVQIDGTLNQVLGKSTKEPIAGFKDIEAKILDKLSTLQMSSQIDNKGVGGLEKEVEKTTKKNKKKSDINNTADEGTIITSFVDKITKSPTKA
eukprot:TRINITY_DN2140_c0_g2_i1.p2 TRINITY_DN2140_c0_g2~~TRINITY_DN2140_c0_g2_i1.p2  ORF type:complete len:146 (-),score=58.26 TRINITY_DN2140_c0_g2_i1:929-1366(-)